MDSVDTKITLHSDGKVLIEGKGGIIIDSASAKLELKGGEISIAGDQRGQDRRRRRRGRRLQPAASSR